MLACHVDTNGMLGYQKAINVLAADKEMDVSKAKEAISDLLYAGLAFTETRMQLALAGCGTSVLPDQRRLNLR